MTTRIAIIGAGLMGEDHARIFAEELPATSLHVVCDRDQDRARAVATAYCAKDVSTDPYTVIGRDDVDAVIVASPDFTHTSLSIACIKANKRVLCEKPLSQSSTQCLDVMATEKASGEQFAQLGFMRRFDQSYLEMKRAGTDGHVGHALIMHNFHHNVETPAEDYTGTMALLIPLRTNLISHDL